MTRPAFEPADMEMNQTAHGISSIYRINDWRNDCYLCRQSELE